MTPEIQEKLQRYLPIRMIVRFHEGKVQGRTELSFSMDWNDSRVNVFWSGKAHSILGEHNLDGVSWAEGNMNKWNFKEFMIDPLAEDSPIEVDWEKWLAATDKYDKRNAPFIVKPNGAWQLRAMAAERELNELRPQLESISKQLQAAEDREESLKQILNPTEEE